MPSNNCESLDTNILLRLITNDNPGQHQRALQLISRKNILYVIDDLAISEMVYVLTRDYRYSRPHIRKVILETLLLPNLSCNYGLAEDVLNLYVKHPSFSFDDCYLVAKANLSQATPLWTFDHKLAIQSPIAQEPPK